MTHTKPLRTIHVDDDPGARAQIAALLRNTSSVEYAGSFADATEARDFLQKERVDLALLDIEMPGHDGLWLATELGDSGPQVVFVTGHAGYAAQAFEACALDYLLKPLDEDRLFVLVERVRHRCARPSTAGEQIAAVAKYLEGTKRPNRIFINMVGEISIVNLDEVVFFASSNNYTTVLLTSGKRLTASKTIKVYEEALKNHPDFVRISRYYIVNKASITAIQRDARTRRITLVLRSSDVLETSFKTKEEMMAVIAD